LETEEGALVSDGGTAVDSSMVLVKRRLSSAISTWSD
jgi:hypothetical protein